MNTSQFDFTWTNPGPAQRSALKFAEGHPSDLPTKEVALAIFTAEQSEWMRNIRWFYLATPQDFPDEVIIPLKRMCELLILMVDKTGWRSGGWWMMSAAKVDELKDLLVSNKPFMDFLPQFFNLFTTRGLEIVENLLTEHTAEKVIQPDEPMSDEEIEALRRRRAQAMFDYYAKKDAEEKSFTQSLRDDKDIPF